MFPEYKETVNNIRTQAIPMAYTYLVRLDRDITAPADFQEEIATIRAASAADVIHLTVNSGGGRLDTMKAIMNALEQTEAHIIYELEGEAASAVTLPFMIADEYRVSDNATMMLHFASFGAGGQGEQVLDQIVHTHASCERLMRKYYKHFLSEEELDAMVKGKEFWMEADEIIERLEKRQAAFEIEQEEAEQADLAEQVAQLEEMMGIEDVPSESELKKMTKAQLIDFILGDDEEPEEE